MYGIETRSLNSGFSSYVNAGKEIRTVIGKNLNRNDKALGKRKSRKSLKFHPVVAVRAFRMLYSVWTVLYEETVSASAVYVRSISEIRSIRTYMEANRKITHTHTLGKVYMCVCVVYESFRFSDDSQFRRVNKTCGISSDTVIIRSVGDNIIAYVYC